MFNKISDVREYCEKNHISMIDFKMIDINGRWRHITIPASRLNEDTMKNGIGFDGSNYGFAPVNKSDMVFIPDLSSAHIDPFTDIPTITMIGDVCVIGKEENKPFEQYPRNVALHAEKFMRENKIADSMIIGPEFEFHILDHVSYECKPNHVAYEIDTMQAEWNSGLNDIKNSGYHVPLKGGYHISAPHDVSFNLRSKMCLLLEDWGVQVKYHHHEVGGPGQQEIEVELGSMVEMADKTMITKYVINNIDPQENGWCPYDFNLYDLSDEEKKKLDALPKTLDEALDALETDNDYLTRGGVFPQSLLDLWIKNKRAESDMINKIPHPAEMAYYYDL